MSERPAVTAIRHSVVVEAPIDKAFKVFTEDFGRFKPPEHNLLGVEVGETVFEAKVGGFLYDRGVDRREAAGPASWPTSLPVGNLHRHGETWEGVREAVDGDQGWPLYLRRYAALFDQRS